MDQEQIEQGKKLIQSLYQPAPSSHKGENGKVMVIGGSHLFHAASLWALKVVSRMVDMTFYSSVPENNEIVQKEKEEFRDGIIVPRSQIESYFEEADCILIGPGMERTEITNSKSQIPNKLQIQNLNELDSFIDAGLHTYLLTKYLLMKYPNKKWVIDAGSLQMVVPGLLPKNAILTPHQKEFETLKSKMQNLKCKIEMQNLKLEEQVNLFAQEYNCVVLLKGEKDIIASKDQFQVIEGGNAGLTKGGTGDVLAGLVAGFYAKNDAFSSAVAASFLNKLAGERLFGEMGFMYNVSDLVNMIPAIYCECLKS